MNKPGFEIATAFANLWVGFAGFYNNNAGLARVSERSSHSRKIYCLRCFFRRQFRVVEYILNIVQVIQHIQEFLEHWNVITGDFSGRFR